MKATSSGPFEAQQMPPFHALLTPCGHATTKPKVSESPRKPESPAWIAAVADSPWKSSTSGTAEAPE
jgi:hypothetical protein